MNDWLDYKGSGSARTGILAHAVGKIGTEADYKQRTAYSRLVDALIEKAEKQLSELEGVSKSIEDIDSRIRENTRGDKNYNTNGLLQRKKAYLVRRSTINNELNSTIKEAGDKLRRMRSEIGYSALDGVSGIYYQEQSDKQRKLKHIDFERMLLIKYT